MNESMKKSGIEWIGEIPESWSINKIKYLAILKGRIGWQGLTSEEYQDDGAYLTYDKLKSRTIPSFHLIKPSSTRLNA